MIITRDASTYRTLQSNLAQASSTLNQLYIKSSTGVEVARASDNPSAVAAIINGRTDIVQGDRYIANCKHVQDNLSSSETYMNSVEDIMTRAKEIAITGANGSLSASDRSTLNDEVGQMQASLVNLANSQVDGKYLFAGYNDQTPPFSGTPVTYNGTDDHQMIEINPGTTVAKNITGEDLFMSPNNLFGALQDLSDALTGGDTTTISNQLTPLENGADQVRTQLSLLGNNSARMDDMISLHENVQIQVKSTLSDHQDADLTEVLSNISKMENSLQATMQVTARVSSLSLMNYLS